MAAQDFRHAMQKDAEVVADFTRRLERTFRIAYGNDRLSVETREAFLYSQLQEGLCTDLMQNPSVSGALTYKTLCIAARNEEQRMEEMKKRRNYRNGGHGEHEDLKRREVVQRSRVPSGYPTRNQQQQEGGSCRDTSTPRPNEDTRECYNCGKRGHLMKDCPSCKSESRGQGPQASGTFKKVRITTKQVRSTLSERGNPDDPTSYLHSDSEQEGEVRLVTIKDQGSKPQGARVLIGGVATWGVVDSGADINLPLWVRSCSSKLPPCAS